MIIVIVLGSSLVAYLFKREQTIGAMVLLVLLLLTFIFYGLRWFPGGKLNGTGGSKVAWPPIVNMCPDFMVAWTAPAAQAASTAIVANDVFCYDTGNIYGLKTATANADIGLISGIRINGLANQSALKMGSTADPAGKKMSVVRPASGISPVQSYPGATTSSPLRWEGVTDGSTVTISNISTA